MEESGLAGFDPLSDSRTALLIITIYVEKRFFIIVAVLFDVFDVFDVRLMSLFDVRYDETAVMKQLRFTSASA
jgi:hypothetical protein